jgi:hypothetical protein
MFSTQTVCTYFESIRDLKYFLAWSLLERGFGGIVASIPVERIVTELRKRQVQEHRACN